MAHNFKLTGNVYVSKAGSDSNDGLTPDTPKLTIAAGLAASVSGNTIVIGAGQYNEENIGLITGRTFKGDGKVYIKGNGSNQFATVNNANSQTFNFDNIIFEDWLNIVAGTTGNGTPIYQINNCIIINCRWILNGFAGAWTLNDSVFVGSEVQFTGRIRSFVRCIFVDALIRNSFQQGGASVNFTSCFLDGNSICKTEGSFSGTVNISNSNFRGIISGNPAAEPTKPVISGTNIDLDPSFNNPSVLDFTLRRTSPHLSKGIGPSWLKLGRGFYLKGSADVEITETSGHYFEDISSNQQFLIYYADNIEATLQDGQLRMKIIEAVGGSFIGKIRIKIRVAEVPVTLSTINFVAGLNFNTNYPVLESQFDANNPQVFNNNVPNGYNWTSGHEGRNPNRLDYSMRWSIKDNPNLNTNSDWISGSERLIFEWDSIPVYNPVTQKGNADPDFVLSPVDTNDIPVKIFATWIDMEITLMNNYFSK